MVYYKELSNINKNENTTKNSQANESTHSKIKIVILTYDNPNFSDEKWYETNLLGKPIISYITDELKSFNPSIAKVNASDNLIDKIKKHASKHTHVVVLYCDTPLLTKKVVEECIDFCVLKNLDMCKLTRGYIFKSDYLNNYNPETPYMPFEYYADYFSPITNSSEFSFVYSQMQQRINSKHQNLGVLIHSTNSTHIDFNVTIEKGVEIYPNNYFYGNTHIAKNSIIYPTNTIINSKIGENSKISCSYIDNSEIISDSEIKPWSTIKNKHKSNEKN